MANDAESMYAIAMSVLSAKVQTWKRGAIRTTAEEVGVEFFDFRDWFGDDMLDGIFIVFVTKHG